MTPRSNESTNRLARLAWTLFGWAVCLFLFTSQAGAQDGQVYFTYSAEDIGPASTWSIAIPSNGGSVPLHLWIQGGGSASTGGPCQLGSTGNEICAVNVTLHGNGFFAFTDFAPNQAFDSGPSAVPMLANVTPDQLSLNGLDFGTPGLGNRYLGVVSVLPLGDPSQEDAVTAAGGVMRSNMEMWDVAHRNLIVPEPGFGSALALGALGLACLRRRRA